MATLSNYDLAFSELLKIPVPYIKYAAQQLHRQRRNHRQRCQALAMLLEFQHADQIARAPDASWMPKCFPVYLAEWIKDFT